MLRDVCDRDKEIPAKKVAECLQTSKKADVGELARRMGQGDREAAAQFMHEYGDLIRRRIHGKMHAGVRRVERLRDQEASDEPEPPAGLRGLSLEEMLAPLHSEDDRTIATLWALDVPYTQIAAETGLSYDVVRQRWHRIQEALRSAHSETKT